VPKRGLGIDVLEAARIRTAAIFDEFDRVCVSFSGGKDSTVMLHLAAAEARKRNRSFAVLFVDLEGQYKLTIEHVSRCLENYGDIVEPYWVALPLNLRNAVSSYEPQWLCWDPEREDDWVRPRPDVAIGDEDHFPFFRAGMEFEEFVPAFNEWFASGQLAASMVGIRSDESLNKYQSLVADKVRYHDWKRWTWKGAWCYNVYPIYDWKTEDVWTFHARYPELAYNPLYDRMQAAGLPLHNQRICQPYGDDQRKGLWLFHVIEPETWGRIVARVNGANSGALYSREVGNILGNRKITLPDNHTWESFAMLLLDTLPERASEHYKNKIAVFLKWWMERGFERGIPDEADPKDEASRAVPSWRRICKAILRNDYWCKGLSFSQHKSEAYEKYLSVMKKRRAKWNLI